MIALVLFSNIMQCIQCTCFIKLVDTDNICIVKHVNFFQLRCSPIFRSHHIQTNIAEFQNRSIALSYTGRLQNYHIKACGFTDINGFLNMSTKCSIVITGSQASHISAIVCNGIPHRFFSWKDLQKQQQWFYLYNCSGIFLQFHQ